MNTTAEQKACKQLKRGWPSRKRLEKGEYWVERVYLGEV
jgi:hypothetical protein